MVMFQPPYGLFEDFLTIIVCQELNRAYAYSPVFLWVALGVSIIFLMFTCSFCNHQISKSYGWYGGYSFSQDHGSVEHGVFERQLLLEIHPLFTESLFYSEEG